MDAWAFGLRNLRSHINGITPHTSHFLVSLDAEFGLAHVTQIGQAGALRNVCVCVCVYLVPSVQDPQLLGSSKWSEMDLSAYILIL